ncbi:peroxiredoxin-5, mitochondrial-like [Dreissena polymorpha]|uniref:Peroxiredoxin-5 n=1 Tax=Dreissena polymorpha TaxID=45954 RepID=A0A9D4KR41_DREPO|nr:peroxiredoxin-5, mitochondrial-like [Dreissena polymorpha]KAH3844296.1 hypothetical protein DPMN_086553 [Dreissena polymorpha]
MRVISQASFKLISRTGKVLSRGIFTNRAAVMAPIKVGDTLPSVDLFEGNPGGKVNTKEAFGKGKHVIFSIVGAFTPTCQAEQFPTFVADIEKMKSKGVKSVNCVSVNDPFVMDAFGKALSAGGKVRCLADTCGAFTKAIEMELDLAAVLGNVRSKRYVMVVEDGKVKAIKVEADSTKATCSRSTDVLALL